LLGWTAVSVLGSAAALALIDVDPPLSQIGLPLALMAALCAACLLFVLLSGDAPCRRLPPRRRAGPTWVKGTYLTVTSATEEVLWRWLVLGGLAPVLGLAPAFVAATAGFAAAHGSRRLDALAVHGLTGGAFGAVYVGTGRIEAAIVAHALYNWFVVTAIEAGLPAAPKPASVAVLEDVGKRYRKVEALRGFSLGVETGEVVALLGPNGAGKTTALSILLGLRAPDRGTVTLFGRDPHDPEARRRVGVTPQETGFPNTLRVAEVVELVRAHYAGAAETAEALERFGLAELGRRQVGGLSGGQKRRLALVLAFVGNPRAVVLDEPTTGLDVESRRRVWNAVRTYAEEGGTVLLTTHNLDEADALASRIVVMSGGVTIAEGSPSEVKARAGLKLVRLEADSLPLLPGVEHADRNGRVHSLYTPDPGAVVTQLVEHGVPLRGLEVTPVSLEEAFLALTQQ